MSQSRSRAGPATHPQLNRSDSNAAAPPGAHGFDVLPRQLRHVGECSAKSRCFICSPGRFIDDAKPDNPSPTASSPNASSPAAAGTPPQRDRETVGRAYRDDRSYRDDDDDDDYDRDDYHGHRMMRGWMHDRGFGRGWMRDRDDARGPMQDRGWGQGRMAFGMGPGMGGPFVMRMMMALMDTDNDGTISLQEFQTAHERIFKAMDTNKDGRVTPEEFQNFMSGTRTTAQAPGQQQTPAQHQ